MTSPHSLESIRARQKRLKSILARAKLDALILNAGPSLTYFTGLHFHLMERPILALFPAEGMPIIVLPELEQGKLAELERDLLAFTYGEDPKIWQDAFNDAAAASGLSQARLGVEDTQLRVLELRYLETAFPKARFESGAETISALRQIKDTSEVEAMQRAAEIAEQALLAMLPTIKAGASEKQIASELVQQLFKHGSDTELPFFPIVASGPNSANGHHTASDRKLQVGDLLIVDWGASVGGYLSDITRTFAVGEVDEELQRIHAVVELANQAGRAAARPGASCAAVDKAARDAIEDAGYGEYFIHRTGHGLGIEPHEAPYIRAGNNIALEEGMSFTIEPGIYIEGRGGVRIEDDVVVTQDGIRSLTNLPRDLQRVG